MHVLSTVKLTVLTTKCMLVRLTPQSDGSIIPFVSGTRVIGALLVVRG